MQKKSIIKIDKLLMVLILILACGFVLTACGGGLSYLKNPPDDPVKLVERMEQDGWHIDFNEPFMFGGIHGQRLINYSNRNSTSPNSSDNVAVEDAKIRYFDDEKNAKNYNDTMYGNYQDVIDNYNNSVSNVTYSYFAVQKRNIVSFYLKAVGTYEDVIRGSYGDPIDDGISNTAMIDNIIDNFDEPVVLEDKILVQATIEQDFTDDTVLVIIDKNFFYRQFTVEDFAAVNAVSVSWLTESYLADPPEALNHIYAIKLGETGKQNVLDAIKILETFDFVKCAEPNYIYRLITPVDLTPIP